MSEITVFPNNDNLSYNRRLINALLKVKNYLLIRKELTNSVMIKKSDFKKIVDDVKNNNANDVKIALENIFNEYFPTADLKNNEGNKVSKGVSYVKRDSHHNSSNLNSDAA